MDDLDSMEAVHFQAVINTYLCLKGKNKPYESILILSSNFVQRPKSVCHIFKATAISHTGKQIATDSDNYTPNYIGAMS